jgi:hypothetical protein
MRIDADDKRLQYCGRIDWSNGKEPIFVYPCTSLRVRFTGNMLKLHVKNQNGYWDNYLGCMVDGNQSALMLPKEGEAVLEIPVNEKEENVHEVLFFKRQDSCHELTVLGLEIQDGEQLLELPNLPARKIEVYGDSVSAGEVSEAVAYAGKEDPEHNGEYSNSWYSYAWMTARKLNAQLHDIAQGGIALMDKTGWFYEPDAIGMETAWNKIHYNPTFENQMDWDFSKYTPQVVIVAIGQNDNHPDDYMKEDYDGERAVIWREHYRAFLQKIRAQYPDAYIVCCTTLLMHDASWDRAITEAVESLDDSKISKYSFVRNGVGTPGHLRIPEAEEMAGELAAYIEGLHVEGWE